MCPIQDVGTDFGSGFKNNWGLASFEQVGGGGQPNGTGTNHCNR